MTTSRRTLPTALTEICVTLNVDRCTVIEFGEEGKNRGWYTAARPGGHGSHDEPVPDEWGWLTRRLVDRHSVVVSRLEDLPMEAQNEREYGRRSGLSTTLAMPVSFGDRGTYALVLGSAQRLRDWQGPIQHRARLLAEIIGSALQRARQEAALRSSLAEIQRLNSRLTADNVCLKEDIKTFHDFDEIVGGSAVMRDALERLAQVAPLNCSVLLLGETGTGKELFARAVHERSRRRSRALVRGLQRVRRGMFRRHDHSDAALLEAAHDLGCDACTAGRITQELAELFFAPILPDKARLYRHPRHQNTSGVLVRRCRSTTSR